MLHPDLDPLTSCIAERQHRDCFTLLTMIMVEANLKTVWGPQGKSERGVGVHICSACFDLKFCMFAHNSHNSFFSDLVGLVLGTLQP